MPEIRKVSARAEYATFVHKATLGLCRRWRRLTMSEIGYGRAAKLLNLVLKKLACLRSIPQGNREKLILLQHVPLDRYTIVGLRAVAPELLIPSNATMKHIETHDQYRTFQAKIASVAKKANVPAIYCDILAWNMAH